MYISVTGFLLYLSRACRVANPPPFHQAVIRSDHNWFLLQGVSCNKQKRWYQKRHRNPEGSCYGLQVVKKWNDVYICILYIYRYTGVYI